jgi:hypothetical protein
MTLHLIADDIVLNDDVGTDEEVANVGSRWINK